MRSATETGRLALAALVVDGAEGGVNHVHGLPEWGVTITLIRDNAPILAFARRLAAMKRPMWLRYVLVPGLTDVRSEMEQIAEFAAGLGVVERAEVLPFHQMGRFKWEKLGMDYQLKDTQPPSQSTVDEALARFRATGLKAV